MSDDKMQTDIALLNQEVAGLLRSVADVSAKMDMVLSMQISLQRLQDRSDRQEMDFRRYEEEHRRVSDKLRNDLDTCFKVANGARDTISTWVNRGLGGIFVGGLLLGCLQWFVLRELTTYSRGAEQIQAVIPRLEKVECALIEKCAK